MLSRRDMVGKLAAGTAAVVVAGAARTSLGLVRDEEPQRAANDAPRVDDAASAMPVGEPGPVDTEKAPVPWELLRPLAVGSLVAPGWRLVRFTGVVEGSCVVTLENERGRAHRVHICRNDGRPKGLVYTRQFDLVAMNGGQGDLPTDEGFAQAVAELSHTLAANEAQHEHLVTALLPQVEREQRFADGASLR